MTVHDHTPDHEPSDGSTTTVDDAAIDALARQAGAELRRPAPEGFGDGIRRARRRQQVTRAALGGAGALVVIAVAVAAIAGTGNDGSVVPATDPPVTTSVPSPTSPPVTTVPPGITVPQAGADPDGVPDFVYAPSAFVDGVPQQDVFDPLTLELLRTEPAVSFEAEPRVGGTSRSGIGYVAPGADADLDACNQTLSAAWAPGIDLSGLPERVAEIVISADGTMGAAIGSDCVAGGSVTVVAFNPDNATTGRTMVRADGDAETVRIGGLQLSDDGSYLLVTTSPLPLTEGIASQIRVIETATGDVVAAIGAEQSGDLPRTECGLGFVSMGFVGNSALAYAAICPEGIATVVRDLSTGATFDRLHPEFAGRTYETMPSANFVVDRATLSNPADPWYILCVDPLDGGAPCWLGHGDDDLRGIPVSQGGIARFESWG